MTAAACASRSHTRLASGLRARSASIKGSHFATDSLIAMHIRSTLSASGCDRPCLQLFTAEGCTFSARAAALSEACLHVSQYLSSKTIVVFNLQAS